MKHRDKLTSSMWFRIPSFITMFGCYGNNYNCKRQLLF